MACWIPRFVGSVWPLGEDQSLGISVTYTEEKHNVTSLSRGRGRVSMLPGLYIKLSPKILKTGK